MYRHLRMAALLLCAVFCAGVLRAESTVYVIIPTVGGGNFSLNLSVNGEDCGSLLGSVKKTIKPDKMTGIQIPSKLYHATIKKCVFQTEGKALFRIDAENTNIMKPEETAKYYGEVQLDLADGETYYIQLKSKGLFNMQLVEIPAKKGVKAVENRKKYETLPDWTESEL